MAPRRRYRTAVCLLVLLVAAVGTAGLATSDPGATERVWSTPLADDLEAAPVVGIDRVYVANGTSLTALDARTGQPRWSRSLPAPVAAPPRLVAGTVRVVDTTGTLHAFTAVTGGGSHSVQPSRAPPTAVASADETVYLFSNATLRAVSLRDLAVRWTRPLETDRPRMRATADTLVVATSDTVHAIEPRNGTTRWRTSLPSSAVGSPALTPDRVGILTAAGKVHVLDSTDGTARWQAAVSASAVSTGTIEGSPSGFYVTTSETLVAVDDGEVRWRLALPSPATALQPTPGEILVGTTTGTLLGVDTSSGVDLWRASVASAPLSRPALGAAVYVGAADGRVMALTPGILEVHLTASRPESGADTITVAATIENHHAESLTRPVRIEAGGRTATVDQRLPPEEPITVQFTSVRAFEPTVTVGPVRKTLPLSADPRRSLTPDPQNGTASTATVYIREPPEESRPTETIPGFGLLAAMLATLLFGALARWQA